MPDEIAGIAPNVRIGTIPVGSGIDDAMERGPINCAVSPEQFQHHGELQEPLLTERHGLLGWVRQSAFPRSVTEAAYDTAGYVRVELSNARSFAEDQVLARGDRRRIEVVASSFTIVPCRASLRTQTPECRRA